MLPLHISPDCETELALLTFRCMDQMTLRSYAARIILSKNDDHSDYWNATVVFEAVETGIYQSMLVNKSDGSVSCKYMVLKE